MTPPLSLQQKEQLSDLYYKEKNFFGRDKLYKLAISKGLNISRRQIMDWLKDQEIYQRYLKPERAKTIQTTILSKPNKQIGIDLIDMQNKEYNKYKYILTAIDLFSKKAYAQPLKNKTDIETTKAMKKIINSIKGDISSIRSDNGSEFKGEKFINLLKSKNIRQVFSLPYKPQSNGNIEKFNGILKKLINISLKTSNSRDWVSILPKLVDNYNNVVNSTTKKTPNEINEENYKEVHENIKKAVSSKRLTDKPKYEKGDKVRIQEFNNKDGTKWSKDIYIVERIFKPRKTISRPYYTLKGLTSKFYDNDLQLVSSVENQIESDEEWEVSKIIKPSVINGIPGYIVRWKGYKPSDDTFEPRDKLLEDIPKMINRFEKEHGIIWKDNRFYW